MAAVFELSVTEDLAAWRNLAQLWGVTLGPGQSCVVAPAAGLRCYRLNGGLETIRQLDRPGFLKLVREDQRVVYAELVGLTDVSAIFRSGGAQQIVPLSDLAGRWHGEYATLWRPPSGYRNADSFSAGGPLTDWLSRKLSFMNGAASTAADARSLPARLAEFQLSHGLEPDGRPGPLTLMQINRLSGVDEPRLNTGR
jgi:general secretion pathway protein A